MTNNPTIDGVSRELLANFLEYSSPISSTEQQWHRDKQALRALLDAPAVERHVAPDPIGYVDQWEIDRIAKGQASWATFWTTDGADNPSRRGSGSLALFTEMPEVAALQSTIAQLRQHKNDYMEAAEETRKALSDDIARLKARVQELESGSGEPVAWANGEQLKLCAASPREVQPNNPMMHNLPRNIAGSSLKTDYCNTPLFTAPPAPAAVVLPERKLESTLENRGDLFTWGWNACLDATAALNTIHVGELDPAQRLALARGETK